MEIQYYSFSFTILLFVFSFFWLLKLYKRSKHQSQKLPPGPWKLPIIGNLHNLAGSLPHRALGELARKHGPLMHLQLGEISAVVASSPRMASEIMKTHDICFAQRPELLASKILTSGGIDIVFAPYGDYWRQMRKLCILELLSAKRVQSFSSIREEEVSKLIKFIRSSAGTPFNFSKKISELLGTTTSRAAYGNKCKDQEVFTAITRKGVELTGGFNLSDLFPSMKFLHVISGMKARLEKIKKEGDGFLDDIINNHKGKRSGEGEEGVEDLVDVLLSKF
ncbi:hypothetical protein UlMin_017554 [Ulmus minor]